MRTIKYIFSILLVALALHSFGQRSFVMERFFPEQDPRPHFLNDSNFEKSRIEIWRHDVRNRISKKVTWDVYDNPVVAHSFLVEQVEVIYEEALDVENWMTRPFETEAGEEELRVEPWMTVPSDAFEYPETECCLAHSCI